MNLYLIGYRGSGKSTVARLVADRLGLASIDADCEIERRAGASIRQIFEKSGEAAFRDHESAVVQALAAGTPQVVALGGGAVLREENRTAIAESGKAVWLRASPLTLWRRIEADPATSARRPSLTSAGGFEEIEHVLTERTPVYAACADYSVDVDEIEPAEIAAKIVDWWKKLSGG